MISKQNAIKNSTQLLDNYQVAVCSNVQLEKCSQTYELMNKGKIIKYFGFGCFM